MKTALITTETKQQVILQPENLREHRVLQMLMLKHADIQVAECELEITEHGTLRKWQQQSYGEKLTPLLVQVQKALPTDPEMITLSKDELTELLEYMRVEPGHLEANTTEVFLQRLNIVRTRSVNAL